jgi:hypothetical protein
MAIRIIVASGALVAALASPAKAQDLTVTLDNQSSEAVHEFYVSPVDAAGWDRNLLTAVLPVGQTTSIAIPDGGRVCHYDLRVVFSEGEQFDDQDIDLCATGGYTISDPAADD